MSSRSNARPTPKLSEAEASSRSSPTKGWDCIAEQAGRLPEMRLAPSRYVMDLILFEGHDVADMHQLFGGSAFAKEKIYHLKNYNDATWFQNFVASIAGASASLIVSAPLDVIKTRIQNRNFDNPKSGFSIVSSMLKEEGVTSFFKGLTPKLLMTGPKLVFSFWLAQTLIPAFDKML